MPGAMDSVDVIVEIPAGSRNKYERDERGQLLRLVRQLPAGITYPADYGYIPLTLSGDGDPLDALVLIDEPSIPGCVVSVRPLGVLWLSDEQGRDPKIITAFLRPGEGPDDLKDLPARKLEEIELFFGIYKVLEPGKGTETHGFGNRAEAEGEIEAARHRFRDRSGSAATRDVI